MPPIFSNIWVRHAGASTSFEQNHSDFSEFSCEVARARMDFKKAGSLMMPAELSFATTAAVTIDVRIIRFPSVTAYLKQGLKKSNDPFETYYPG
jgi:hypothetical protein